MIIVVKLWLPQINHDFATLTITMLFVVNLWSWWNKL